MAQALPQRWTSVMPRSAAVARMYGFSVASRRGGETTAMLFTPATCAGTAFMIRLEMSGVAPPWPPGTYRPTRSTGRTSCPRTVPSASVVIQDCSACR